MKAFHAYDIRGVYNDEFTSADVYKIGYFLPRLLKANKVLVGRDCRLSSPEIFEQLSNGIMDSGADVYDAGQTTTPMIYWSTARMGFDASVMITASHNAKEYNGLKISTTDASPVGYDTGLKEIERKILDHEPIQSTAKKGKIHSIDIRNSYLDFQKQFVPDLSDFKVVIDCSNGMAGLLIRDLLKDSAIYINEKPDGNFPNHDPNPLIPKNVKQLQEAVIREKCEAGVIFDGDADRVMFVDEKGNFVSPDLIIAVLGGYFAREKGLTGNVLQDIRTSKSVTEYIEALGFKMHIWKVGRAYAALKLKEIDGLFGGELAGHYYFRDFYYSDSGILAALLVLGILNRQKKTGVSFSELIGRISKYANSGEVNFRLNHKQEAMESVKNYFISLENPVKIYDFDGYRVEFRDWWFNIRLSNTEPYLRLIAEAGSENLLKEKIKQIEAIIKQYD
ncbi:MAG: phosphomannomutase/phosphoglucomutase [Bacteroidales bacterium]|nr:phosphomannomutase/phosphoglucomutase [Bacteroidales bacterium]